MEGLYLRYLFFTPILRAIRKSFGPGRYCARTRLGISSKKEADYSTRLHSHKYAGRFIFFGHFRPLFFKLSVSFIQWPREFSFFPTLFYPFPAATKFSHFSS